MSTAAAELVWLDGEDKPRGYCWCGCGGQTPTSNPTAHRPDRGQPNKYLAGHYPRPTLGERFFARVGQPDSNGCWPWTGLFHANGYARLSGQFATIPAYRLAYELLVGPIPEGFHVDHLCRNRACVNPQHLEAVTPQENIRRRDEFHGLGRYAVTCSRGHVWADGNEYIHPKSGKRSCHSCGRARDRQRRSPLDQQQARVDAATGGEGL